MMFISHEGHIWWEQEMHGLGKKKGLGDWCRWDNLVSPWATDIQFAYTFCTCSIVASQGETRTSGLGSLERQVWV